MTEHGTAIEWTHVPGYKGETWNPVTGCDRVSPGCAHCYALELAARLKEMGQKRYQRDGDPKTSAPGFGLTLHQDKLDEPLRWRAPRAIFVNSMSDVFHEEIPDEFIARMFAVMGAAPQHIFMVLTKRPARMHALLGRPSWPAKVTMQAAVFAGGEATLFWPLPNVWMGVTIENRRFVGRADLLRDTPTAIRFISAEPLLGPLLASERLGNFLEPTGTFFWPDDYEGPQLNLTDIDWLIVGGESGPSFGKMGPQWVRGLRDAASESNTAFFFKQWGGRTSKAGGREIDGRTWSEFPTAFPEAVV